MSFLKAPWLTILILLAIGACQQSPRSLLYPTMQQQQIDYLNLMNDAITVGRNGQQIHLLEFNNNSLRKVLFNV